MVWIWNIHTMFYSVLAYFNNLIAHSDEELRIVKIWKLDVCGRPLFTNPVTYIVI